MLIVIEFEMLDKTMPYKNTSNGEPICGSKLVSYANESAEKMGCMKTVLYCSDDRMYFYKKLGYSYRDNCMEIQHR